MILLVTNKRDLTTDFIVLELRRRGIAFVRLNSEDLPAATVTFRPGADAGWVVQLGEVTLALRDVRAAYYRRPGTPEPNGQSDDAAAHDYMVAEWSAVLRSFWNTLEGRWLNSPFAILRAEDKPRQMDEALRLGFNIPQTLVGNDFDAVTAFVDGGRTIGKPLRQALIERGPTGEVIFTSRVSGLVAKDRPAITTAPVIYQREVQKTCDIRATVVGRRVFAVAIKSQDSDETQVDWRRGARVDLAHETTTLPLETERRCVALTERFGLRYGAIDLIRDLDGRYWFLENNPNGQWAWIERRTGAPLASAIADELLRIAA